MAPPLSRGELRQLHRAVKPALARLIRPVDVPQAAGLAGVELDGLPRHALGQVAYLEETKRLGPRRSMWRASQRKST